MEFCPECKNFLYPKKGILHCRTCEMEYPMPKKEERARKIMKHDESFLDTRPIFLGRNK